MLKQDVIERAPSNVPLFQNYVFCVTKPSGKKRVIFDMKRLNLYIRLPKLKMFTFDKAYQACLSNQFACRIDLSNAFWHIGVNVNFRRYLAFRFDNVTYVWKAMPFGLRTAPYLFCSLMNTVIKHIRVKFKLDIFFYMDDVIFFGPSHALMVKYARIVVNELQCAGLTINFDKSCLSPTSVVTFLGV